MKYLNCRQFACPQIPSDEWMAATITVTHGVAAVEMLLERSHAVIQQRTQGLKEFLQKCLTTAVDFETTWDMSFGRVLRALESDEVDVVDVLAEVALRFAMRGCPGRWKAVLCEERRLCWDYRWLFPRSGEVSVDSNGTTATVELREKEGEKWASTLHRTDKEWLMVGGDQLSQVGERRPIALLSSQAVPHDMIFEDDFHSIFEFPPITLDIVQPFSAAFEILNRYAPEYLEWVERLLRGVLVCRCQESRTRSSSWMHAPGVILVSWSANPIEVAEMLVHESSHQYFYLVSRLGAVVDGSDIGYYYSPAVQRNRPLSKILTGYHAFANILLFYRTLLRNGLHENPYCVSVEARLADEVEKLEQPLRDNPALTEIGLDLCKPLMEQLCEARSSQVNR